MPVCLALQGSIFLTIGYHQLEGSRVPLKKPFAILEKDTSEGSTGYQVGSVGGVLSWRPPQVRVVARGMVTVLPWPCPSTNWEYSQSSMPTNQQVVGVVREKYKFSARPRPLISKPRA